MSKEIDMFEKAFEKAVDKALHKADEIVKESVVTTLTNIVDDTPYGKPILWKDYPDIDPTYTPGTLKANWNTSVGTLDSSFSSAKKDNSGSSSIARAKNTVEGWNTNKPLYFSNNTPYAYMIEYESHSTQAPRGMMRLNVLSFNTILRAKAKSKGDISG
jgi:hypothetical protein